VEAPGERGGDHPPARVRHREPERHRLPGAPAALGHHHIDGSTLGSAKPFNQAQIDTLFDLAQAHELMRRQLMAALEHGRPMTPAELEVGANWAPRRDG
jgi:hypothetical protein